MLENGKTIFGTIVFFVIIIAIGALFVLLPKQVVSNFEADQFLRIHIRANSNSNDDQNIKYKVKDEIVKVLVPVLSGVSSKEEALTCVQNNLSLIESTANSVLLRAGFNYKSSASLKKEYFPTRTYDNLTLKADTYDAIIVNLGTGQGDNWWCVAYPPMCFVGDKADGSTNIVYRSKLLEIIKKFFN